MTTTMTLRRCMLTVFCAACTAGAGARELDLAKNPLFIGASAKPNLVLTLDDSGSMKAGFMPEGIESTAMPGASCTFRRRAFFSAVHNTIYYDPNKTYEPPLGIDGEALPDSSFTAAPLNGYKPGSPTVDLSTQYYPTFEYDTSHRQIRHKASPLPAVPNCGNIQDSQLFATLPLVTVEGGVEKSAAFYYEHKGGSLDNANFEARGIALDDQTNFANWYTYYRTRSLAARGAVSTVFANVGPSFRFVWQNLTGNKLSATSAVRPFEDTEASGNTPANTTRSNFYAWLYNWVASGQTPLRNATQRVGEFYSRSGAGETNPYREAAAQGGQELSCRANYHLMVTDGYWNEPNPLVNVAGLGDRLTRNPLPDNLQSYVVEGGSETAIYWNEHAHAGAETEECQWQGASGPEELYNCEPSLADLAFHYWATDLRPDLDNTVPRRWRDLSTGITSNVSAPASAADAVLVPEVYFNPKNDPANWQHMVNFVVGLGVAGTLEWPDDYDDLRSGSLKWPTVKNASAVNSDDAWHAAVNSRGEYLQADDPDALRQALENIVAQIEEQAGSAAALTVSAGVERADNFVLRTTYDTHDWSGNVEAISLDADGALGMVLWDAAATLNARPADSREIITSATAAGEGIPFRWSSLPPEWRARLNDAPATAATDDDGLGEQRASYLRGDRSQEQSNGGPFRARLNVLGAIVHGGTTLVAAPAGGYQDMSFPPGSPERIAAEQGEGFAAFVEQYKARPRVAYAAANDGFLHAFDAGSPSGAGTGNERWAYMPYEVSRNIGRLTEPGTGFEPQVDSTPVVRDVYLDGQWRTVLVGAMRRGGQGVYALDITDPEIDESDAGELVLWEFSDEAPGGAGHRLGYSYGKPNIARLPHGGWVALVPGGYNNEEGDGAAGDGQAALFVIDLASGDVLREFVLDSYGLAFPTAADTDDDQVEDMAVAGDVVGNLWRFDFSASAPSAWSVTKLFEADVAEQYPITAPPRIFADTDGGSIVLVGTGKLLEPGDRQVTGAGFQRILAVRERGKDVAEYPWSLAELVQHSFVPIAGSPGVHGIDALDIPDEAGGWTVPLPIEGERVINAAGALFSQGLALVSSIMPAGADPCASGVSGRLYILDALSGAGPGIGEMFDTNGDGAVDSQDNENAVGAATGDGVVEGTPPLITEIGGGSASIPGQGNVSIPVPEWRRRFWREVGDE